MTKPIKIAPSILASDFARLGEQVVAAQSGGADWIHVDVMDGHFVPNITMGPVIVKSIRSVTSLPIDVHLMIESPERYLEDFVTAGADSLTVHVETCPHIHRTIQHIHSLGVRAAVTLNPGTPVEMIREVIPYVDQVLMMSVNPGFGGQTFIERTPRKIEAVRRMLDAENPDADLSVDGGIDTHTIGRVVAAGANVIIAGSAIFRADSGIAAAISNLRIAAATRPAGK
jgi:ribulose-phosphate 3-epimerase